MKLLSKAYYIRKIVRFANNKQKEESRDFIYEDCVRSFRKRLEYNGLPVDEPVQGEESYIKFWQQFCPRVEPYTYRFFSRIVGPDPHIIPEDIAYNYIESVLNPEKFRDFYSDKNMYSRYIHPTNGIPKSYLCRIDGGLLLSEGIYHGFDLSAREIAKIVDGEGKTDKVILKPSNYSHSGQQVMLFERIEGIFTNGDKELSGSFLKNFGTDFVVQEVIEQHPYLSQFSSSSCNTMRIMIYRSVVDESVNVFGAVLRIGHEGSVVDNLFAGGGFVVINVETGELGRVIYNQYGQASDSINNVDFSKESYKLPFWEQAVTFAKSVARQVPHHRLLAQDIVVDKDGQSRLIEFNVDGFNWGFTMYAGKIPFGDKFDEVIKYCLENKKLRK